MIERFMGVCLLVSLLGATEEGGGGSGAPSPQPLSREGRGAAKVGHGYAASIR